MFTRNELLQSPEYWFEDAQNELYRQVVEYKKRKGINQTQLAKELGVTKGYVSQILKGEFNYTLKKLIDISLAIGLVPKIDYIPIAKVVENDSRSGSIQLSTDGQYFMPIKELFMENQKTTQVGIHLTVSKAVSHPSTLASHNKMELA